MIEQKIKVILKGLCPVNAEEIHKHTLLREDLGIDSLKMVELVVGMEESFAIEFDESDLDLSLLQQVGDLYAMLEKYLNLQKEEPAYAV